MLSNQHLASTGETPTDANTLDRHLFITNLVKTAEPQKADDHQAALNRDLEEISKDLREIEDFITVTEEIIRREKERDRDLYERERQRKANCGGGPSNNTGVGYNGSATGATPPQNDRKLSKHSPPPPPPPLPAFQRRSSLPPRTVTYKINRTLSRKPAKSASPRAFKSRLYFKNGRIGCVEAEQDKSNVEKTHELVKYIIKHENDRPLVPLESVHRILEASIVAQSVDSSKDDTPQSKSTIQVSTPVEDVTQHVREEANSLNQESGHMDDESRSPTPVDDDQEFVRDRMQHLIRRFTDRTKKMRNRLEMPPTPSTSSPSPPPQAGCSVASSQQSTDDSKIEPLEEEQSQPGSQTKIFQATKDKTKSLYYPLCNSFQTSACDSKVLDPQGRFYISWLFVVSLSFLYNAWVIPLRSSFPFQTPANSTIWLTVDYCADIIYLIDVLFVKHRLMYLYEGFWVKDTALTRTNYFRKLQFKMDILSLMPLDLLYFKYGTTAVLLRAPRLLKIQSFWEFFKLLDRVIASPHMVRVAKTLAYMLYMIHLTACSYYAYSAYQGLGTNRWVFSGRGHPYVRCFAFATKTATSIGKNPKPENEGELMFMTAAWLMGVFVFALLIGQIRDIIATATRSQSEYKQLVDETLEYMRRLSLPTDLQSRVKMWYTFTWEQQRTLDESHILDSLPANLKTDIAISVHIQTLSKVQLFADCEEALLRELVLKLRSVTFLPGDYVCRKGEVGKEMYIVKVGQVQVMGGLRNDDVLATLSEGSVFGEISLLAINGAEGNRRTADVRSKGFSNLFVLSKSDLNEAIVYYPNAQAILRRRAKSLMRKNAARERAEANASAAGGEPDVVIENPTMPDSPPKLLRTVIQALTDESPAVKLITQGSRRGRKNKDRIAIRNELRENVQPDTVVVDVKDIKSCTIDEHSPDLWAHAKCDDYGSDSNMTDQQKLSSSDENYSCSYAQDDDILSVHDIEFLSTD